MLHTNVIECSGFRSLEDLELEFVNGGVVSFTDGTAQSHNDKDESLPTEWGDTTWGEAACVAGGMALGMGEIAIDVACDTDLSGNNPNQAGLTEAEKLEREKAFLKEGVDGLSDMMPD